jgi:hypothetical protein
MNELLTLAVRAHGGLSGWNRFTSLTATASITGAIWQLKRTDDLQTHLTIPFLYTCPGFVTEELPPWREGGETWRPLKVTFPDSIASHTREQVSYFGEDGLLRRHEYTVDIMDGARGVNYASDYRDVDGILVPTKRRVYAYDDGKNKIPVPLLVAIDFDQIAFAETPNVPTATQPV